jgi:hypothetical protein
MWHVGRHRCLGPKFERVPAGDSRRDVGEGRQDSSVDTALCEATDFVAEVHRQDGGRTEAADLYAHPRLKRWGQPRSVVFVRAGDRRVEAPGREWQRLLVRGRARIDAPQPLTELNDAPIGGQVRS